MFAMMKIRNGVISGMLLVKVYAIDFFRLSKIRRPAARKREQGTLTCQQKAAKQLTGSLTANTKWQNASAANERVLLYVRVRLLHAQQHLWRVTLLVTAIRAHCIQH